ncbi:MAG TPA: molybdenum cofactor guanylyltransferase [Terriglobia bacterium]|nr:molybdenum cofactor guanylyltransferase [Terriglobia bacterium]
MARRYLEVTGLVLAGGASRRMGRPKAALVLGGESMLARQVHLLAAVSRTVAVIGPGEGSGKLAAVRALTPPLVPVIPDELAERGPLAGIYTGLRHTRTEFNLFLGCDLPFMEARFLRHLCERALGSRADVTVPESAGHGLQPLVAVYRRGVVPAIRSSLERGNNKVASFYPRVCCAVLEWPEIARAGFASRIFDNINTPDDYERARRRAEAGPPRGATKPELFGQEALS